MPLPRVVGLGGVVDPVPGGEEAAVEEEAPIITTLVKDMAMEEGRVATPTLARVVGVAATVEVVGVVGEGAMEHHNRAMGKLLTEWGNVYKCKLFSSTGDGGVL